MAGAERVHRSVLPPPNVRRIFCDWTRPLLGQAVELLGGLEQRDFSAVLAVVPTRQAGRRVREALARRAAGQGGAVFAPRLVEPEGLLELLSPVGAGNNASGRMRTASRLECLVTWSEVLCATDLDRVRRVFPMDPAERNSTWGLRLAQQFLRLQADLGEHGLACRDVAARPAGWTDFPELRRWEELALLEAEFVAALGAAGRRDPQAAKRAIAAEPAWPAGFERILILGVPDPLPLAVQALENLALAHPDRGIEVAVFAPATQEAAFDAWGRPLTAAWESRPIEWAEFAAQVRLLPNPSAQAEMATRLAMEYGSSRQHLAIGCADPEVAPALEQALAVAGIPAYNPDGRKRQREGFYHLVGCLADFMREPTYAAVEDTGRCADVIEFLRRRVGPSRFSAARWMAGLDALRQRHLPADLAGARRHAPDLPAEFSEVAPGLAALHDLRRSAAAGGFAAGVAALLREILGDRRIAAGNTEDEILAESASVWMDLVRECGSLEPERGLSPDDWWDLALRLYGESRRFPDKPPGAIELLGWIELLWEDAPHLVVAGVNEGCVPAALPADPFLPENLRERLGLKTGADRLARDTYLLQAIAAARGTSGRLDVLLGKASAEGDPLQPSRLLLQCAPAELPGRVRRLFRALPASGGALPWTRAWQLTPPRPAPGFPEKLAVTALKSWLACPFRFYLRHGLRMEPVDATKSEMDPADFGTLCHSALQAMGEEPRLRDCVDPELLRDFLLTRLDEKVRQTFGAELALPLVIQVESARQRLRRAAELQAQEQWAGWRIIAVERRITVDLAGVTLVARIDRIDRHQDTGAIRVIDYKTADTAAHPAAAHLHNRKRDEAPRPGTTWIDAGGREKVWQDLQLPLYRHALAAEFPELRACGYFNLPKAVGDSALAWWDDYSPDLQASAVACAETVCRAIRAGEFWPPNPRLRPAEDDFVALFHHGAAESVNWEGGR